jgi:hypothetical protein
MIAPKSFCLKNRQLIQECPCKKSNITNFSASQSICLTRAVLGTYINHSVICFNRENVGLFKYPHPGNLHYNSFAKHADMVSRVK